MDSLPVPVLVAALVVLILLAFALKPKGKQQAQEAKTTASDKAASEAPSFPAGPLTIYFGSQTGTAEGFAQQVCGRLRLRAPTPPQPSECPAPPLPTLTPSAPVPSPFRTRHLISHPFPPPTTLLPAPSAPAQMEFDPDGLKQRREALGGQREAVTRLLR